jgi:hypothetical protein
VWPPQDDVGLAVNHITIVITSESLQLFQLFDAARKVSSIFVPQGRRKVARSVSVQRKAGEGGGGLPAPEDGQVLLHTVYGVHSVLYSASEVGILNKIRT